MQDIIGLSIELQLVLVAGYLAYKVAMISKGNADRTEDFLLKVLAFGLIGRRTAEIVAALLVLVSPHPLVVVLAALQLKGVATIAVSIAAAAYWRMAGSNQVSVWMSDHHIYSDDHEASTWLSLSNADAVWNHVHVHMEDGRVLESVFHNAPPNIPTKALIINEDGLLIYITRVIRPDASTLDGDDFADDVFSTATYVPRSKITQIDIGWKQKVKVTS